MRGLLKKARGLPSHAEPRGGHGRPESGCRAGAEMARGGRGQSRGEAGAAVIAGGAAVIGGGTAAGQGRAEPRAAAFGSPRAEGRAGLAAPAGGGRDRALHPLPARRAEQQAPASPALGTAVVSCQGTDGEGLSPHTLGFRSPFGALQHTLLAVLLSTRRTPTNSPVLYFQEGSGVPFGSPTVFQKHTVL